MSRNHRNGARIDRARLVSRAGTARSRLSIVPESRRRFLGGLLATAGGLVLAACGGGGSGSTGTSPSTGANSGTATTNASPGGGVMTSTTTTGAASTGSSGTAGGTGTSGSSGTSNTGGAMAESASGTMLPPGASIIDSSGAQWILSNGAVLKSAVDTGFPATASRVLYWNHTVYAEDGSGNWYVSGANGWNVSVDPRGGAAGTPLTSLFYGMNGHVTYSSGVYATVTAAEQLALLQDLGVTNYRADVYSQLDAQTLANILTGPFANSGVSILPCMLPVYFNQAGTESDAYTLGYQLGVSVATPLKGLVRYIECGNELEAYGLISSGAGNSPGDYNPAYWPAYRGVIRGMIDGVKSVDATIKCGVNVGVALAYTALQMLWDGVTPDGSATGVAGANPLRWDITMYHWYESSGNILGAGPNANINVLAILAQSFGVPIWLTEWGFIPGDTGAAQASYVSRTLSQYYAVREQYNLQSVMLYELISAAPTDDFGLIETDGTTKREAYAAYKDFAAANGV